MPMSLVQVCTEHDVRLAGVLIVLNWNSRCTGILRFVFGEITEVYFLKIVEVTKVNLMEVFDL
jgi:hypothetical protein